MIEIRNIPTELLLFNDGQIEGIPKNPRSISKQRYKELLNSLRDDLEMLELKELWVMEYLDKFVVIAGNMRLKGCIELGVKEIPCKIIPLTVPRIKVKGWAIKDNLSNGDWDTDMLGNEWSDLPLDDWGLMTGFNDEFYTKEIKAPIYEPKNEKPDILNLVDSTKANKLIEEIDSSTLSEEEKNFLRTGAMRHCVFDYSKIADYYSHSNKEMQELMEKSALVIIDYKKAIENGYVKMVDNIMEIQEKDYE